MQWVLEYVALKKRVHVPCVCLSGAQNFCALLANVKLAKKADSTPTNIFRYGSSRKKHANYFLLRARRINEL